MFNLFKKHINIPSIEQNQNTIRQLLNNTKAKFDKFTSDPFAEYRRRKTLPEQYEFGMNCFLDSVTRMQGLEIAQKTYELIKQNPHSYTICVACPPATPETGIPILFTVANLHVCLMAQRRAMDVLIGATEKSTDIVALLKHERGELITMSREGITSFVYSEPEPTKVIGLDLVIRTFNETVRSMKTEQEPLSVFRTQYELLHDNKTKITPEIQIIYKSKLAKYWHFIFIHGLDEIYIYGQNDRKVIFPYCVDESGSVTLIATCSFRRKLFPQAQELNESDLKQIDVVYTYRPYADTIEDLLSSIQP